jgi:hypothetical protein
MQASKHHIMSKIPSSIEIVNTHMSVGIVLNAIIYNIWKCGDIISTVLWFG